MKSNIIIIMILLIQIFVSCTDELDSRGVSKVTNYATITLVGEKWNVIPKDGEWTEPGFGATEAGKDIPVVVGGDVVDTTTPGVYTITYTSTNKDDFSNTEYRYIGVISPEVVGIDLSGSYKRNAGAGGVSTVTKIKDNLYSTDNIGGVADPGASTTVNFYHYADTLLSVPYQIVVGTHFEAINATVKVGTSYSWSVLNPGYGTQLRTFIKQ